LPFERCPITAITTSDYSCYWSTLITWLCIQMSHSAQAQTSWILMS